MRHLSVTVSGEEEYKTGAGKRLATMGACRLRAALRARSGRHHAQPDISYLAQENGVVVRGLTAHA